MSSACFEHHVFITRKTVCTYNFMVCFSCIYVSSLIGGKRVFDITYTNGLPDDEQVMIETWEGTNN